MSKYYKIVCPELYYSSFIDEGVRPDGRALTESRKTLIKTGELQHVHGSACVSFGSTIVMCAVVAEASDTMPGDSLEDYLDLKVDFAHNNRQNLRPHQTSNISLLHNHLLNSFLLNSECLQLNHLYEQTAKFYWRLRIEVMVLNDDGCLMDAITTCLLLSLRHTKLPRVTREESGLVVERDVESGVGLKVEEALVSISFCILDNGSLIADATRSEEAVVRGRVVLVASLTSSCIFPLYTRGASLEKMKECYALGRQRVLFLAELLKQ